MNANQADIRSMEANRPLDAVRGLAAVAVILGHSRFFAVNAVGEQTGSLGALQKVLLAPTAFAVESVGIFFVLSGYLVGGQVLRQVEANRFQWRTYIAKRLSRLWTVLIPGLILTLLIDSAMQPSAEFNRMSNPRSDAVTTLLCNSIFLQESRCPTFGSNDSLWSLSYEFWFYIIFAAATVAILSMRRRQFSRATAAVIAGAAVIAVFGWQVLALMPAWLLGVALARIEHGSWAVRLASTRSRSIGWAYGGALGFFACGLIVSNAYVDPTSLTGRAVDLLVIGVASTPALALPALRRPFNTHPVMRAFARLGDWSYSSYIFHAPIVKLVIALIGVDALQGGSLVVAIYAAAAIAYVASIAIWAMTEKHTGTVRRLMLRLVRA